MPCSQLGVCLDMATVLFLLCDPSSDICLALFLLLNQLITATDLATVEASNFQLDRKTRFIIHGFIDKGEENWLLNMCKVGAPHHPAPSHSRQRSAPRCNPHSPSVPEVGKGNRERTLLCKNHQGKPGFPGYPLSSSPNTTTSGQSAPLEAERNQGPVRKSQTGKQLESAYRALLSNRTFFAVGNVLYLHCPNQEPGSG